MTLLAIVVYLLPTNIEEMNFLIQGKEFPKGHPIIKERKDSGAHMRKAKYSQLCFGADSVASQLSLVNKTSRL